MQSDPASASTWVRGRPEAVANGWSGGAGASEQLTFTPAASDVDGFVLVNNAGSGSYTLYVDTTAPTGSVLIDDGRAKTRTLDVDLAHLVSDPQTGLDQMRVSIDGRRHRVPRRVQRGQQLQVLEDKGADQSGGGHRSWSDAVTRPRRQR